MIEGSRTALNQPPLNQAIEGIAKPALAAGWCAHIEQTATDGGHAKTVRGCIGDVKCQHHGREGMPDHRRDRHRQSAQPAQNLRRQHLVQSSGLLN